MGGWVNPYPNYYEFLTNEFFYFDIIFKIQIIGGMMSQKQYELRPLKYEKEANEKNKLEETLDPMVQVLKESGAIGYIEPDEFKSMILEFNIREHEYAKFAKTVTYVRMRFIYKKSRYESFRVAFPERFASSENKNTIETKARRVEEYRYYKMIVAVLVSNMHISYFAGRLKVLDLAMDKITDSKISERDRVEYMKLFLQETRKPDNVKGMELNVNIQQNNISISKVEEKMTEVGSKLEGLNADQILEVFDGN